MVASATRTFAVQTGVAGLGRQSLTLDVGLDDVRTAGVQRVRRQGERRNGQDQTLRDERVRADDHLVGLAGDDQGSLGRQTTGGSRTRRAIDRLPPHGTGLLPDGETRRHLAACRGEVADVERAQPVVVVREVVVQIEAEGLGRDCHRVVGDQDVGPDHHRAVVPVRVGSTCHSRGLAPGDDPSRTGQVARRLGLEVEGVDHRVEVVVRLERTADALLDAEEGQLPSRPTV